MKRPPGGLLLATTGGLAAGYGLTPNRALASAPAQAQAFPWDVVIAIAALILVVAFLTASGVALTGLRKSRLRQLAEEGVRAVAPAQRLLEEPNRFLATIQVGITLASMFAAALAARTPVERLAEWLTRVNSGSMPAASALDVSLVLIILAVAAAEILFGEFIPRRLAIRYTEPIGLRVAGLFAVLTTLASPVVSSLIFLTNMLMRPFGGTGEMTAAHLTEEEIKNIVEESEKEGVLEEQETEMIHSVLEFTDIVVHEVMVPRIDMVCVDVNRSLDELLDVVLASGHTRIPIYEETVDNIIGTVHAKDLLRVVRNDSREIDIRSAGIMRSVYYVPENMKVDDLLAEFQQTKTQMAIVVDEYGGTAGLVTLEDLLEEIVGPITDEYDVEIEPAISLIDENVALVDARMAIDDVNDELHLRLPEEESETLGGFVFSLLGKIPSVGEVVEYDNVRVEVIEADSRRVTRVKITRQPDDAEEAADSEERGH